MLKYSILVCSLLVLNFSIFGQEKTDLESKRENTLKEIALTTTLLNKTTKNKKDELSSIYLLKKRIQLRESLIRNINQEIIQIDTLINNNVKIISSLEDDLVKLKEEYAKMIYNAYKNKSAYQKLGFIFSSETFNQAYKRIKYLQQYADYRKKQAELIQLTKSVLVYKNEELLGQRAEKLKFLESKNREVDNLENEKRQKDLLVNRLKKKEKDLEKQLKEQRAIAQKIQKEIDKLIAEDLKKSGGKSSYQLTPDEKIVSDNFERNKSRLPWPTERGLIILEFGEYWHPVLKGIKMNNNGVDIETDEGAIVRAVFKGDVKKVFMIPGSNAAVIIRHGSYLTVYSNLTEVNVRPGDVVETKQVIGKAFTDKIRGNKTILHFEVLKEMMRLDPELWLSKN